MLLYAIDLINALAEEVCQLSGHLYSAPVNLQWANLTFISKKPDRHYNWKPCHSRWGRGQIKEPTTL